MCDRYSAHLCTAYLPLHSQLTGNFGAPGEPYPPGESRTVAASGHQSSAPTTVAGYINPHTAESGTLPTQNTFPQQGSSTAPYSQTPSASDDSTTYNFSTSGSNYSYGQEYNSAANFNQFPPHSSSANVSSSSVASSTASQSTHLPPSSSYPSANSEQSSSEHVKYSQPKRLHVSNIPFRFREPDLRHLFYVSLNRLTSFSDPARHIGQ